MDGIDTGDHDGAGLSAARRLINARLEEAGAEIIAEPNRLAEKLLRYLSLLERWNPTHKLVKGGREELVERHIVDSLKPLGRIAGLLPAPPACSIADIGSGAGLPGIPLALALQKRWNRLRMTLIEPSRRRCGFLLNAVAELGLCGSVAVEESRFQQMTGGTVKNFDLAVSRAAFPINAKFLRDAGGFSRLVLYRYALKEEETALLHACGRRCRIENGVVIIG